MQACTPKDLEFSYIFLYIIFQAFRTWKVIFTKFNVSNMENLTEIQKSAIRVLSLAFVLILVKRQTSYILSYHTEEEVSIIWKKASWRYIVDQQTQMYVPVARISREQNWRRVCILTDNDANENEVERSLCRMFVRQQLKLASMNITYAEVWLTRERGYAPLEMFFDNIVKGNCSHYTRKMLVLASCIGKGMDTK